MEAVANWEWLLAIVFLLGSIFCSGSETSLTALGEARTHQLVDSGGRRARLLRLWLEHPDRVLSTLLIGNTLANIGAGALAGDIAKAEKELVWVKGSRYYEQTAGLIERARKSPVAQ